MSADIGYLQIKISELNDKINKVILRNEKLEAHLNKTLKETIKLSEVLTNLIDEADKNSGINIVKKLSSDDIKQISDYVWAKNISKAVRKLNDSNSQEIKRVLEKLSLEQSTIINNMVNSKVKSMNIANEIIDYFEKKRNNK